MRNMSIVKFVLIIFLFLFYCSNNKVDGILNGDFIPDSELNSKPILLSPENNEIFLNDFFMIWTAVSNSTKYVVEISDDYNFNNIVSVKEVENEQLQISISELTDHSAKFYCRITPFANRTRGISSEIFQFNILLKGIIYVSVSSTASDQGHGLSNDPFKSIEDAVFYANLIDGVQKIYIAEGTYTSEVSITNNIEIYGGFSKLDWSLRDKDTYKSVIFPEIYSAFTITGSNSPFVIIDGIIIDNIASGNSFGILNSVSSSLVISNNLFYNSTEMRGYTGLFMTNSDITIQNCQFLTTSSNYIPPSVYYYNSLIKCLNSTFYGSVSFIGKSIDISNSFFNYNVDYYVENINIENSCFNSNLYLYQTGNGDVLLKNNTINAYFGFNCCDTCKANVLNNIISKVNTYGNYIGSIRINSCSTSVPNGNINFMGNIVANNSSIGISFNIASSVSTNIINNTIIRYNLASMVYGSFLGFYVTSSNNNINLVNNLFADTGNNTENSMISFMSYSNSNDKPNIVNNLFTGTNMINNALSLNNSGTFSVDALNTYLGTTSNTYDYYYTNIFTDINNTASAYVLKSTATTAIDKGINFLIKGSSISDILVTDISLIHPRLYGTAIDIGAYEYQ